MRYLVLAAVTVAFLLPAGIAMAMPDSSDGDPAASTPPPAPAPPPSIDDVIPTQTTPDYVNQIGGGSDGTATVSWPSGCRTVDLSTEQRSFLFKVLIYRFHQIKHWCWGNGVVSDERHAWSFDGSSTACLGTIYPANSWYFTWWHDKANSGHYSEERAHVTNCVFHLGDWKEFYPDVKIWAYADGTYRVSTAN